MIHYHGLPITGSDQPILSMVGKHCMVSFANKGQMDMAAEVCQSFTIDNGAFSFWKGGKPLDVGAFAEWVSLWSLHPGCDWYCLPDVIDGGPDENAAIRAKFFNRVDSQVWRRGVPIWHMDEPLDVLACFLNWPNSTIAIGSSGQYASVGTQKWWGRMAEAMEVVCDEEGRPRKKLHGLRMLDPTIFSHIPLSSADSTNVARNVGLDVNWDKNAYSPKSKKMRALVMMDRIEGHASASRWNFNSVGIQKNMELFG